MELLKKENWWLFLILYLTTGNLFVLFVGALLNIYDDKEWYAQSRNWLIALLLFIFPIFIMFAVFVITILTKVAAKLDVAGKEIYLSPYIWILCIIIPILGWIALIVMTLYLEIMILISLYNGKAEKYIRK